MFEFFGWACINIITVGDDYEEDVEAEANFLHNLKEQIEAIADKGIVEIHLDERVHEDLHALSIAGLTNHRCETVIELFRWLSSNAPQAYGLLYVRDGEDHKRGHNYENVFRVWRLRRGVLDELADPFLNDHI
jgi:hypothetical protein